jgi:hypothetical protein
MDKTLKELMQRKISLDFMIEQKNCVPSHPSFTIGVHACVLFFGSG